MRKFLTLLAFALLCAPALFAQKEYGLKFSSLINDNLTLENAIRIGLENNTDFLAAKEEIIIAEQRVQEAKFLFLPQFSVQGTATLYDLDYPTVLPESVANRFIPDSKSLGDEDQFYGVGISATQYLYSGGRLNNTLKIARANLKQVQSKYDTVKNAVVLNIKKAFINLLYAQYEAELSQSVLEKAERYYQSLRLSAWEKVQARSILSSLASARSLAVSNLKKAELNMLVALNKELNAKIKVEGEFKPVKLSLDLPHLNLWSMEFRPELKSAIYALELDNIAIDLALSRRYPDVILTGSYEQLGFDNLNDVNKQVSLAVRFPLPYTLGTQFKQKKAEQKQSALKRSAMEDKIHVQVAESFENMMFWQTEVLDRQEAFNEVASLLKEAEKTAKAGVTPLQALTAYRQTASDYYESVKNNLSSKAALEWAIGQDL